MVIVATYAVVGALAIGLSVVLTTAVVLRLAATFKAEEPREVLPERSRAPQAEALSLAG
jgi:hypothetical protein